MSKTTLVPAGMFVMTLSALYLIFVDMTDLALWFAFIAGLITTICG